MEGPHDDLGHKTSGQTRKQDLDRVDRDPPPEPPSVELRPATASVATPPEEASRRPRRRLEGFRPNPKARLLDQCREVLRFHHFSYRTVQTYVDWIRRFILFQGKRHPREMGASEINQFLSYLATEGQVAASTQNQACRRPRRQRCQGPGNHAACKSPTEAGTTHGVGARGVATGSIGRRGRGVVARCLEPEVSCGRPGMDLALGVPVARTGHGPEIGRPAPASSLGCGRAARCTGGRGAGGNPAARHTAHVAPFVRHPPLGVRHRHSHSPGIARASGCLDHPDLHSCHAGAGNRREKSAGLAGGRRTEARASEPQGFSGWGSGNRGSKPQDFKPCPEFFIPQIRSSNFFPIP